MEIRLGYRWKDKRLSSSISITMRTPGHDFELALGFLVSEGIIERIEQVDRVDICGEPTPDGFHNVIRVELADDVRFDLSRLQRHVYTTSSCGVCGKASLDALEVQRHIEPFEHNFFMSPEILITCPSILRDAQRVFAQTGGLHATGLFSQTGELHCLREDVGRHNAMDKLVGAMLQDHRLPLSQSMVLLSGRVSFELMQKAIMAGVECVAAIGAPSSLAVEMARRYNVTLVGFLRREHFNVYHAPQRLGMS